MTARPKLSSTMTTTFGRSVVSRRSAGALSGRLPRTASKRAARSASSKKRYWSAKRSCLPIVERNEKTGFVAAWFRKRVGEKQTFETLATEGPVPPRTARKSSPASSTIARLPMAAARRASRSPSKSRTTRR